MFEDIPFVSDAWDMIPDEIIGIPKCAFFGLLIGIIIACKEGIFTKFNDTALKIKINENETIIFNKTYIVSGLIAGIVTFLTVMAVMETGMLEGVTAFGTAFAIGLAEGGQTIKYLNKRIDLHIKKCAVKVGATDEQAEKLADAVEFVEVDEPKEPKKPLSVSFEEL